MGPSWLCTNFSVNMIWLLAWCFWGTPNSWSKSVSGSFSCSLACFIHIWLPCPVLIWMLFLSLYYLILSSGVLGSWRPASLWRRMEREWNWGRGEERASWEEWREWTLEEQPLIEPQSLFSCPSSFCFSYLTFYLFFISTICHYISKVTALFSVVLWSFVSLKRECYGNFTCIFLASILCVYVCVNMFLWCLSLVHNKWIMLWWRTFSFCFLFLLLSWHSLMYL